MTMRRLIIVSNRLPVTIGSRTDGLDLVPSTGGLATGLSSLDKGMKQIWVGWPGRSVNDQFEKQSITQTLAALNMLPVFIDEADKLLFYDGFSNKVVWPHFHYFTQFTTYNDDYWEAYQRVNALFAEVVCNIIEEGDLVWIHDYHLMLLPQMVRQQHPNTPIGFFLHIPFPSYEIFRVLPWRKQILLGLLGADQIGFHAFGYMRHFLSAVYRITGYENNFGKVALGDRLVNVDVFPMGIDYEKFAQLPSESAQASISSTSRGQKIILSIDRLDYTKGIPERIRAFERFLLKYPQYKGKVCLVMIVVPSRATVDEYKLLKHEVDTLVGRINSELSTYEWSPIRYFYRALDFPDLVRLYHLADIALVTPLRDGMNLVAKEYVASKEHSKHGVLILSEMAGSSSELMEAILVNPQDANDIAEAIVQAMEMSEDKQQSRLEKMQENLKKYGVQYWAESFINDLEQQYEERNRQYTNLLTDDKLDALVADYKKAEKRLLLLDYDGTLMSFQNDPKLVVPDAELRRLLAALIEPSGNRVVIVTGRDREDMIEWFADLPLDMATEHGAWLKRKGRWRTSFNFFNSWKKDIRPVLENLVKRTPGSFIEEKAFSLAWHYRRIDRDLGEKRLRELRDVLLYLTANLDLQVLEGNKVLEIKNSGVNKGKAVLNWLKDENWDFIMAIGDDNTDEDTFRVLPDKAYTIKVGHGQTHAHYKLLGVEDVRGLLAQLAS